MYEKTMQNVVASIDQVDENVAEGARATEAASEERRPTYSAKLTEYRNELKQRLSSLPKKKGKGGPATERGKAVASRNSLKSGVYAKTILPESDTYWMLDAAMHSDLRPQGKVESMLVSSGVRSLCGLVSIQDLKQRRVLASENTNIDTCELARRVNFPWAKGHQYVLEESISAPMLLRRIQMRWAVLAKPPKANQPNEVMAPADSLIAALYDRAKRVLTLPAPNPYMDDLFLNQLDLVMLHARDGKNYLGKRVWVFRSNVTSDSGRT